MRKAHTAALVIQMALATGAVSVSDLQNKKRSKTKNHERAKQLAKERRDKLKAENLAQLALIESKRISSKESLSDDFLQNYYKQQSGIKNSEERLIAEKNATPNWCDKDELLAIHNKRKEMSNGDIKYHVDHVIPLRGKLVSGLNVPDNLRIIPAKENVKKGNRFNID